MALMDRRICAMTLSMDIAMNLGIAARERVCCHYSFFVSSLTPCQVTPNKYNDGHAVHAGAARHGGPDSAPRPCQPRPRDGKKQQAGRCPGGRRKGRCSHARWIARRPALLRGVPLEVPVGVPAHGHGRLVSLFSRCIFSFWVLPLSH